MLWGNKYGGYCWKVITIKLLTFHLQTALTIYRKGQQPVIDIYLLLPNFHFLGAEKEEIFQSVKKFLHIQAYNEVVICLNGPQDVAPKDDLAPSGRDISLTVILWLGHFHDDAFYY